MISTSRIETDDLSCHVSRVIRKSMIYYGEVSDKSTAGMLYDEVIITPI